MSATPHRRPTQISVLGSVNLDFIIRTSTLPRAGETVGEGVLSTHPGGKGANVALTAQRLGADVTFWACVGRDSYADTALNLLKSEGVDLNALTYLDDQPTGVAFINVADDGENQIAVASGANMAFTPAHLEKFTAQAVITQFEIPTETILAAISKADMFVCLNASPVGPSLEPLLPFVDLIIVNAGEYEVYGDSLGGFDGMVAITLGAKGAQLLKAGVEIARAVPPPVNVVDTTGAGDSFAAALSVALIEGQTPQDALDFACTVGALTTSRLGTQPAVPRRSDVDKVLQSTI